MDSKKKNSNAGKSKVTNAKRSQFGGTILGIIIGLVIGLGIAVVVAMMITKTSTPFTNKLGITKGDAPTVQLTDPNKPLYGSTAKEIMANAAKQGDDASASAPNVSTSIAPVQPAPARAPDTVKPDAAKVDPKNVKPSDSVVAKNDGDDKAPTYYLQVGAFRDSSDAEGSRAKLALLGIESHVTNNSTDGDNLYRVRIGPFDQLDNMNRMRAKLTENSIDVAVIKTPR
jgi:cell division protein FtsN